MGNIDFYVSGDIPSKKNSKVWTGKFLVSSKVHRLWHKEAMNYWKTFLHTKLPKALPLPNIYDVTLTFFPKTLRKFDLTNKAETVMDYLVDCGIIEDDNWSVIPRISLLYGAKNKENPGCLVKISCKNDGKE